MATWQGEKFRPASAIMSLLFGAMDKTRLFVALDLRHTTIMNGDLHGAITQLSDFFANHVQPVEFFFRERGDWFGFVRHIECRFANAHQLVYIK